LLRLKKTTVKKLYKRLTRTPKQKANVKKKRMKKLEAKRTRKECMIRTFGKTRYYLALWFGPWLLYFCNTEFYKFKRELRGLKQE
jgi:hypothetical protein